MGSPRCFVGSLLLIWLVFTCCSYCLFLLVFIASFSGYSNLDFPFGFLSHFYTQHCIITALFIRHQHWTIRQHFSLHITFHLIWHILHNTSLQWCNSKHTHKLLNIYNAIKNMFIINCMCWHIPINMQCVSYICNTRDYHVCSVDYCVCLICFYGYNCHFPCLRGYDGHNRNWRIVTE